MLFLGDQNYCFPSLIMKMELMPQSEFNPFLFQLPVDLSSLTEEEKAIRLAKRKPRQKIVIQEEIEDTFDVNQYSHLWKRK